MNDQWGDQTPVPQREPSPIFVLWVVIAMGLQVVALAQWFQVMDEVAVRFSAYIAYGMPVVIASEIVFLGAILAWRQWGVYGYLLLLVIDLTARLFTGLLHPFPLITALVSAGMVWYFALRKIDRYD